ncbi:MAG: hypothetical protein ACOZCO_10270 [Bacteroidota bacterium]
MKIGVLDTDHYFYIYTLVQLFGENGNEITIYTNPKIYKRCQTDLKGLSNVNYFVQEENESWGDFMMKNSDRINQSGFDYFFLLPIYGHYKEHYEFISKLTTNNILVVFNLNGWINPPFSGLRNISKNRYKKMTIEMMECIAVDEHYDSCARKRGFTKKIIHIPSTLYNPGLHLHTELKESPVKIIVPGSIDKERRDYHIVLDALEMVMKKRKDFSVILLGDPIGEYGKEIQLRAKSINEQNSSDIILWYDKLYSDAEFAKQMFSGHFLIAPVLPEFKLDGITEIYGLSKSTGSCFDLLAFAIPGIFPSWLSVNPRLDSATLRYQNKEELKEVLLHLLDHPEKIKELRKKALQNSSWYTIDLVRSRLMKSLPLPQLQR